MLLLCCHGKNGTQAQVALTVKAVGLSENSDHVVQLREFVAVLCLADIIGAAAAAAAEGVGTFTPIQVDERLVCAAYTEHFYDADVEKVCNPSCQPPTFRDITFL
jgi:hypothetical protein